MSTVASLGSSPAPMDLPSNQMASGNAAQASPATQMPPPASPGAKETQGLLERLLWLVGKGQHNVQFRIDRIGSHMKTGVIAGDNLKGDIQQMEEWASTTHNLTQCVRLAVCAHEESSWDNVSFTQVFDDPRGRP